MIRVAIDCDPGRDDALAIVGLLGALDVQVDLISTVSGNVTLDQAVHNALGTLAVAGIADVPLYRGAERPLERPLNAGTSMHGDMGEEEPRLPEASGAIAGPSQPALEAWGMEPSSETKRLVAIGPLTNIGRLLRSNPDALREIDEIYMMGGTLSQMATRVSASAEFNFFTDPEAAEIVLSAGIPVRLYDYDVTTSCQIPVDCVEEIGRRIGGRLGTYVSGWLQNLWEYANKVYGRAGIAVHDMYAAAGAAGIGPGRWKSVNLVVDRNDAGRGTLLQVSQDRPHFVARDLDVERMIDFLVDSACRLPTSGH